MTEDSLFRHEPPSITSLAEEAARMGGRVFTKVLPEGRSCAVLVEVRADGTATAGDGWEAVIEDGMLAGVRQVAAVA